MYFVQLLFGSQCSQVFGQKFSLYQEGSILKHGTKYNLKRREREERETTDFKTEKNTFRI